MAGGDGSPALVASARAGSPRRAPRRGALAALEAVGQAPRFPGWQESTAAEPEVRSGEPIEIGVDGEALTMDPPQRFTIRPAALTVRLPRRAVGLSPAAGVVRPASRSTLHALARLALGRAEGHA